MSTELRPKIDSSQPTLYQIRTYSQLVPHWAYRFQGMTITLQDNGDTLLTGTVDQAALHGLLRQVRDMGLILISVMRLEANQTDSQMVEP